MASAKKQAVSQPQFIIKTQNGTYYLTVSLWVYDPKEPASANKAANNAFTTIDTEFTRLYADPANQVQAVQVPNATPVEYMAMAT
jgi:hypothetical protein